MCEIGRKCGADAVDTVLYEDARRQIDPRRRIISPPKMAIQFTTIDLSPFNHKKLHNSAATYGVKLSVCIVLLM